LVAEKSCFNFNPDADGGELKILADRLAQQAMESMEQASDPKASPTATNGKSASAKA
jgi:hypothetical protein